MNDNYCSTPQCREDLKQDIKDAESKLHTKINNGLRTKMSSKTVYSICSLIIAIILGTASLMYYSYAGARDERTDQIKENRCAIEEIKKSQIRTETILELELPNIKELLKQHQKVQEEMLREIQKRNNRNGP